jgi:hypothetical protein
MLNLLGQEEVFGTYNCSIKRVEDYPPNQTTTTWYYNQVHALINDTLSQNEFTIMDSTLCNDPVIINLPCTYLETLDGNLSFTGFVNGFSSSGQFWPDTDSLYLQNFADGVFGGQGGIYYYYYGKKITTGYTETEGKSGIKINVSQDGNSLIMTSGTCDFINPPLKYFIYDLSGKIVSKAVLNRFEINIGYLPKGFYLIKIESDGRIKTDKFFKL